MTSSKQLRSGEPQPYCPLCRSESRESRKQVRALDWMPMEECRHPWHNEPAAEQSEVSANFIAEVRNPEPCPSCHVCGAEMVPDRYKCLSCGANTKPTQGASTVSQPSDLNKFARDWYGERLGFGSFSGDEQIPGMGQEEFFCLLEDLLATFGAAALVSQWISVEERLPEKSGTHRVALSNHELHWDTGLQTWCDEDGDEAFYSKNVTHWLPTPPKENL